MRAFDHMVRESRSAPKPATPEAPEWKGPPQSWLEAKREIDEGWDGPSITPDQVADFIARRKAKRDRTARIFAGVRDYADVEREMAAEHEDAKRAEPLSRALSTPLPHDPPMSVRLMPWRGKE